MPKFTSQIFDDPSYPCYIIAEIGINHNGDIRKALELVDVAKDAGCDCVKFQKRNPDACVPEAQKDVMRDTPWGEMTYLDYRKMVEFDEHDYDVIASYCQALNIEWSASAWDIDSIDFLMKYDIPFLKIPSAKVLDKAYLRAIRRTGKPLVVSTGMTTMEMVREMWYHIGSDRIAIMHTVSEYPCKNRDVNLRTLPTLHKEFKCPIGYSGHEKGIQVSVAAVAMGARIIERHITLDRTMWGTDQAASLEPQGLTQLVRDIRIVEEAFGDGIKRFTNGEKEVARRLRG